MWPSSNIDHQRIRCWIRDSLYIYILYINLQLLQIYAFSQKIRIFCFKTHVIRHVGMDFASSVGVQAGRTRLGLVTWLGSCEPKKQKQKLGGDEGTIWWPYLFLGGGNSNIFWNLHPENWGKIPIFRWGWNYQPVFFRSHFFFGSVTLVCFLWKLWVWRGEFAAKKGISNNRKFLIEIFGEASCKTKTFFVATGFLQTASPSAKSQLMFFLLRSCKYIGGRGIEIMIKKLTP